MARAASASLPTADVEAFLALISSILARLARASGASLPESLDASLLDLLTYFGVDQCGIIEVQADVRQARLRHVVSAAGVQRAPTTVEYGTLFPWIHAKTVFEGELLALGCVEDELPASATSDRASAAALGLRTLIAVPVGRAGRVTHVLCLTGTRPIGPWPRDVLARLRMVAETFLAVLSRHAAEQALQASERSLAEAQRIAGIGSFVHDWVDGSLFGSPEANRIFGVALGESSCDVHDFADDADRVRVRDAFEQSLAQLAPVLELEYHIVRPDGMVRTIRTRAETAYAADGTPLRTLGTIRDVTELRAAEREARRLRLELRHADRAAHAGTLTASLSHELNQPLTAILANAQAGLRLLAADGGGTIREILEAIVRDDKRAAAVVDSLRALLRREEPPRTSFDLGSACSEVLTLFKSELDARSIQVNVQVDAACIVSAVRTQIQQVMLNLLANALQALQDRDGERRLTLVLSAAGDDHVEVSVRDTGVGLPAGRHDRVFDPYFTTRSEGLGMGLAICRSIIEAHEGTIAARPNDEGGATLSFALPVERFLPLAAEPGSRVDTRPAGGLPTGEAVICIVDDDSAIREGVARRLAAEGWRCVAFDSATAALASDVLASAHCIVLDVQMPGMAGTEFQDELARRGVAAPIVFLTARADATTGVEAMKRGAFEYLAKPVDDVLLVDAVRRALCRHAELAAARIERSAAQGRLAKLTSRELDVLRLVIAGRLNKQIAAELSISEATVKQHRGQVMDKMAVRSVADLVRMCDAAGLAAPH